MQGQTPPWKVLTINISSPPGPLQPSGSEGERSAQVKLRKGMALPFPTIQSQGF